LRRAFPVFHQVFKGFNHHKKYFFVGSDLNSKNGHVILELMNQFSNGIIMYGTPIINDNYFFQGQCRVSQFVSGFLFCRIKD
jgi:hypothetical protein